MPIYKDPHHGISLSEALHEAAVTAPAGRAMLSTFELYHPTGTPDGPVYVVSNSEAITATKESGAARDAGVAVEWLPVAITINRPEESDTASTPQITLTVSNVSGLMSAALRAARGSLVPWELLEREYASDDLTGPAALPPLLLYVTNADIEGETLTLTASFGDSANVSIPRLTFRRAEYPGLVR
jgi:hypothetical protein